MKLHINWELTNTLVQNLQKDSIWRSEISNISQRNGARANISHTTEIKTTRIDEYCSFIKISENKFGADDILLNNFARRIFLFICDIYYCAEKLLFKLYYYI